MTTANYASQQGDVLSSVGLESDDSMFYPEPGFFQSQVLPYDIPMNFLSPLE